MNNTNSDKENLVETKINWHEIKEKILLMNGAKDNVSIQKSEIIKDELKKRAKELASEDLDKNDNKNLTEIVAFNLSTEKYGIETEYIIEVYPLKDFTNLPGVPDFILGIINVRGRIVSVIDLKKFFNIKGSALGELNKVLIVKNLGIEFGILADDIIGSFSVETITIQSQQELSSEIGAEYLKGVTGDDIIILDTAKIIDDGKIIIHQNPE